MIRKNIFFIALTLFVFSAHGGQTSAKRTISFTNGTEGRLVGKFGYLVLGITVKNNENKEVTHSLDLPDKTTQPMTLSSGDEIQEITIYEYKTDADGHKQEPWIYSETHLNRKRGKKETVAKGSNIFFDNGELSKYNAYKITRNLNPTASQKFNIEGMGKKIK
jgi:flagellar basal body rod protein FlgG